MSVPDLAPDDDDDVYRGNGLEKERRGEKKKEGEMMSETERKREETV